MTENPLTPFEIVFLIGCLRAHNHRDGIEKDLQKRIQDKLLEMAKYNRINNPTSVGIIGEKMVTDDKSYDNRIIKYADNVSCQWGMCKQLQDKYNKAIEFIKTLDFENWCGKRLQYATKSECQIVLDARNLLKELNQQEPEHELS